jgi:hypothetical protein
MLLLLLLLLPLCDSVPVCAAADLSAMAL